MTRAKAIDKVRKLRALAAGAGNRAEAETAFGKAFELAKEHGLTDADLQLKPVPIKSHKYQAPQPLYVHVDTGEGHDELSEVFGSAIVDIFDALKSALLKDLGVRPVQHSRRRA
jgi:hypothetical protein